MKPFNKTLRLGAAMVAATAFSGAVATQASAEINLAGKTVEFVIPFSTGGGSDKWARFYAPLLSEALPGKPTVVVKNMPGAGSTKGANWFHSRAKGDGLTIFGSSGSTQFPYILGDRRVKYDYRDWQVVLGTATGGVAYMSPDMIAKWKKDPSSIKGTKFIFGSQGATRLDLIPILAWQLLGLQVDPVFGVKSRGTGRLMFERGEANIDYQTAPAFLSKVTPLVKAGKAAPMMTWGALDADGNIVRDPTFPNVPTFKEEYKRVHGKAPSGPAWEAWKAFFIAGFAAQKMVFLPKSASKEVVETYTNAFKRVVARADFAKISKKRLGVYPQATGAQAAKYKKLATEVNPEATAWVKKWLSDRFGVKLK